MVLRNPPSSKNLTLVLVGLIYFWYNSVISTPRMAAITKPPRTIYFWHVQKSDRLSMLHRINEAKKAKSTFKKVRVKLVITTAGAQKKIIQAIKSNTIDAHDFADGIVITLTTIYNYLPEIDKDIIQEALTQWDIKILNEGIFIPSQYFD